MSRYPKNPFIEEVCEHYPQRIADSDRNARVWLAMMGRSPAEDCECGDCFYCDGD